MQDEAIVGDADGSPPCALPQPERIQHLLFDAARLGRDDVIPALLYAGACIDGRDASGYTPLILACYHGHEAAAAVLIEHGAQPDAGDVARGNTALMGSAFKGLTAIAALLLDHDAAPDATNNAGQTALMFAALFGRREIVELLLTRGADPHRVDAAGNSAVSLARAQNNELLVAQLARSPPGVKQPPIWE